MKVQSLYDTSFKARVKTLHVLEITTQKIFEPDGFLGMTKTMRELYDIPPKTGSDGYKKYAKIIGEKIMKKYSVIADKTTQFKLYLRRNRNASFGELQSYARSLASKIGEEIDIVI